MQKIVVILLLLLAGHSAFPQGFELGKVTLDELREEFHPSDSSAPAAILYRRGKTYFELSGFFWVLVTEVENRIKIYSKAGYDYATEEFSYYTGRGNVIFSEACTYNINGDAIEATKIGPEGEIFQQVNKYISSKRINLPNVKEGSVIEYKYKLRTRSFSTFDWYFQDKVPVNHSEYEVRIPSYFTYRSFLRGAADIKQSAPTDIKTRQYTDVRISYSADNVKALREEAYVDNIKNYMSVLKYELIVADFTKGEFVSDIASGWAAVLKTLYEDEDFGKQLDEKSYFRKDINRLLVPGLTDEGKLKIIFDHVKSRMNWNGRNGYMCVWGVKDAYNERVGNSADINLMLTAMLRYAGLRANPVLISTRANGLATSYPSLTSYNYVATAVEMGNKLILLDATSKHMHPGMLPPKALNGTGRIIYPDRHPKEIDLMPTELSKEMVNIVAQVHEDGKISGKVRSQYQNYYAYNFRENNAGLNTDSQIQRLHKKYAGIDVSDYKIFNIDKDSPVSEEFSFSHTNLADVIGGRIYISPLLFFSQGENPFKQETREYPIDFTFPFQDRYIVNISIPQGYEAEFLPKPVSLVMGQNIGSFKYNIASVDNQLQLSVSYEINDAVVSEENYRPLKDFFQKMIDKQNEKIILRKL